MSASPEGWVTGDGAMHLGEYSITSANDVCKVWRRPPFQNHILIGVFEEEVHAQVAAEMYEEGRLAAWAEVKERLGF